MADFRWSSVRPCGEFEIKSDNRGHSDPQIDFLQLITQKFFCHSFYFSPWNVPHCSLPETRSLFLEATHAGRNVEEWRVLPSVFSFSLSRPLDCSPLSLRLSWWKSALLYNREETRSPWHTVLLSENVTKCVSEAGNENTMTLASAPGDAKFTHLSLRGIFLCRAAKGRNKSIECTSRWLLQ